VVGAQNESVNSGIGEVELLRGLPIDVFTEEREVGKIGLIS
jgi:hypothetical protein